MPTPAKPASKLKMAVMWFLVVGNVVFWVGLWLYLSRDQRPEPPGESAPALLHMIVFLVCGVLSLLAGAAAYAIILFTNCLTFNFQEPVWNRLKPKLYFANIIVPTAVGLGFGFALSAFLSPVLVAWGVNPSIASLGPILVIVGLISMMQVLLLVWAPLERSIIRKRLAAQGITPLQMQSALLVGISNPDRSSFKKMGAVEEDIGALWLSPERLVFWGDMEQFSLTREEVVQLERSADAGSTTFLIGMTHLILHVRLPDQSIRRIRLHTEGIWTMGGKRRAMDNLAEAIERWHQPNPATA